MTRKLEMPAKINKNSMRVTLIETSDEIKQILQSTDVDTKEISPEVYSRLLDYNIKRHAALLQALHDYDVK